MNEIIETTSSAPVVAENFKEIAIEWLTSTGNLQKFTEQEKMQFCDICSAYGLNPIKKEVYGIKYGNNFNLIVGYESYIKRAERSGLLDGWKVDVIGSGNEMKAVITINRKDWRNAFVHEVYFEEYNTNQNLWKTKPRTMIKKVAIAQGFRMCFSETLGGMPYTREELPEEMSTSAPTEKNITPTSSDTNQKTSTQSNDLANKLGQILNSEYADGSSIFNDVEIESYREMLRAGKVEEAYTKALEEYASRNPDIVF